MRRRIILSQRRDETGPPWNETRDALDTRLSAFVVEAGALPFPLPSALTEAALSDWLAVVRPDGIMLSGGADPGRDPVRDRLEGALMVYAERHELPLLGLCRGLQVMASVAGAALQPVAGHVATRHALSGQITRTVNSYHGHAPATCPANFTVIATAPDGTIEAIRHDTLPWEGWMWHPERDTPFDPADLSAFRKVFSCAP